MYLKNKDLGLIVDQASSEDGLETIVTIPKKYSYMSDVFIDLPDDAFLCKSVAGVGGTTLAIDNNIPYVIAVGSVELIQNKCDQKSHLIPVYGDITGSNFEDIIHSIKSQESPKIMTTYDSLPRVVKALGVDVKRFKLLVDELQVLLKASDKFKPAVVYKLFQCVGLFKSVCYMTATPTPRKYFPPEVAKLEYVRLVWEGSSKLQIKKKQVGKDLNTKVLSIALNHLDNGGTPIFFYNSLHGIVACIKQLRKVRKLTHEDIKIICADTESNRNFLKLSLGKDWIPERPLYKEKDEDGNIILNPRNKPIQFCTKYAFEGMDFIVPDGYTYIISDVRSHNRDHSRIDISTDIQQIAGRCRDKNPLCQREAVFLWTNPVANVDMSAEDFEKYTRDTIDKFHGIISEVEFLEQHSVDFNSCPYLVEIDKKHVVNDYAYYGMCISHSALNVDYVNVMIDGEDLDTVSTKLDLFGDTENYILPNLKSEDRSKLNKKLNFKEWCEEYNEFYSVETDEAKAEINRLCGLNKDFADMVKVVGFDKIKGYHYHKTKCTKLYQQELGVDPIKKSVQSVVSKLNLKVGTFISLADVKVMIQEKLDEKGIKHKAKSTDLLTKFDVKRARRFGSEGYIILNKINNRTR